MPITQAEFAERLADATAEWLNSKNIGHDYCVLSSRLVTLALQHVGIKARIAGCRLLGKCEAKNCQVILASGENFDDDAHAVVIATLDGKTYLIDSALSQMHHMHGSRQFPELATAIIPLESDPSDNWTLEISAESEGGIPITLTYYFRPQNPLWCAGSPDMTRSPEDLARLIH